MLPGTYPDICVAQTTRGTIIASCVRVEKRWKREERLLSDSGPFHDPSCPACAAIAIGHAASLRT